MRRGRVGNLLWSGGTWLGVGFLVVLVSWAANGVNDGDEPGSVSGDTERTQAQRSREEFDSPVWALAVSTGGSYLGWATVGGDLWIKELSGSRSFRLDRGPMGSTRSLAIAPDGHVLAAAGTGASVRLWDLEQGRPLDSLPVGGDMAKTVAFAPSGSLLAVGEWGEGGFDAVSL